MLPSPGLFKRLLVITYDGLLLAGVLFASYALLFLLTAWLPAEIQQLGVIKAAKFLYLLAVSFAFYGWFWVHGGQTLGMKAWNLYLINEDGKFISWRQSLIRYFSALLSWVVLGLGFAWILLSRSNLAWHDTLSGSRIVKYHANDKQKT